MTEEIELIDVAAALSQVRIDLKYASADNITGERIYRAARCLLHPDAAAALARSVEIAALSGYRLLIYDAYRPQKAQENLWQACPDPRYVAPLSRGSHHSRGVALDITLLDDNGQALDMGTGFDELGDRSHPFHPGVPRRAQRNRLLLNAVMFGGGLRGSATEWWHFELPDAMSYPLLRDRFPCFAPRPMTRARTAP